MWSNTFLAYLFLVTSLLAYSTVEAADADSILTATYASDSVKINALNDYAWSIIRSDPAKSMEIVQQAEKMAAAHEHYSIGQINANTIIGVLNKDKGYYQLAVEAYLKALKAAEKVGDTLRVSGCLNNIGVVYQAQENYVKALDYFKRSLKIEDSSGKDPVQKSIRLFNIGEMYVQLDSLDKAYAYFYNSLLIEQQLNNTEGIYYALLGIGTVDIKQQRYQKGLEELTKALRMAQASDDPPAVCDIYLATGNLYFLQKKYAQALKYFQQADQMALDNGYKDKHMEALEAMYKTYNDQKQYAKAITTLNEYYALREQLNNISINSKIEELQTQYQLEKKEKQIAELTKQEEVKQLQLNHQKSIRNYLLFTILLTVLFFILNIKRLKEVMIRNNDEKNS